MARSMMTTPDRTPHPHWWTLALPLALGCFLAAYAPWLHRHTHDGVHATFVHPGLHDAATARGVAHVPAPGHRGHVHGPHEGRPPHPHPHAHGEPAAADASHVPERTPASDEGSDGWHLHLWVLFADHGRRFTATLERFWAVLFTVPGAPSHQDARSGDSRLHLPRGPPPASPLSFSRR